ncbi:MAG: hypothetical protein C0501_19940 [Isosphaera sp.]|nr:hypothetical protein [Isosphaera sp.]
MRTFLVAAVVCGAGAGAHLLTRGAAGGPGEAVAPAPVPPPAAPPRLVAHEWGTFTSFSGADGVAVGFSPNNTDLPQFVYFQENQLSKVNRLRVDGLVSMETPVIYFYADKETRASVKVDFPRGWITEWYPFAAGPPGAGQLAKPAGQSIRWDLKLTPGESAAFPRDRNDRDNHYYHARETAAAPLQVEVGEPDENGGNPELRGGTVVQREKFLFYRGVGAFPPPVTVRALGGDKVRVVNNSGGRVTGAVLVAVRGGTLGFRPVGDLDAGAEVAADLPAAGGTRAELAAFLVKELTAAGLYADEARAMVKSWDAAWFGEEGTRLLYLVPRSKTDELLPLTIDPKPAELVRVLVGRHDFLTPEQEASADATVARVRAAEAELNAARAELARLGRFAAEAQRAAANRLDAKAAPQK